MDGQTAKNSESGKGDKENALCSTTLYGWNFRGFRKLRVPLDETIFLVGDNSSGKSSILHLVSCILASDLAEMPRLDDELGVDQFDFFSPYFNYSDVTLGYEVVKDGRRLGKLVTLKRVRNKAPKIARCSYFADGRVVSIKASSGSRYRRSRTLDANCDFDKFFKLHNEGRGFQRLETRRRGALVNQIVTLFDAIGSVEGNDDILDAAIPDLMAARHIAPVRSLPEKYYDLKRRFTSDGTHFAVMWQDFIRESQKGFAEIGQFGRESHLFDKIHVEEVSKKLDQPPLIVKVEKNKQNFLLNQVGVGISQVVPVLVESVVAARHKGQFGLLLQQPELHLHPVAQAALGTFFHSTTHKFVPTIVETHSNFLIDRFRSEIKEAEGDDGTKSRILFCQNSEDGNVCHSIGIDGAGKLISPPTEYFSFFVSELSRTML